MSLSMNSVVNLWTRIGTRWLPFADAASDEVSLARLLRLALFQIPVGMAMVLMTGTINRVMIVELGVHAWLVAIMIAIPILFAPLRTLIGHRSDTHRSVLGWRRTPYLWIGLLLQFGGYVVLPPSLLLLSGNAHTTGDAALIVGQGGAALAFLLIGFGIHYSQTAGLALVNDVVPEDRRPRAVALMYMMLLVGMILSAIAFSFLLNDFSSDLLIRVIHGAAVFSVVLNFISMWKQEARDAGRAALARTDRPAFSATWRTYTEGRPAVRLLVAVFLGTMAFGMQDVLLEPYGGEILSLTVSQTTLLTALMAGGTLTGFFIAVRVFSRGMHACRLAAIGALIGLPGFAAVLFANPFDSTLMFNLGTALIGMGTGLFAVGSLTATMELASQDTSGLAAGAWGGVQATAVGLGIASGGALRDIVGSIAATGALGEAMNTPAAGYATVYCIEIVLLFATLIAIGPLVRETGNFSKRYVSKFGLTEMPG